MTTASKLTAVRFYTPLDPYYYTVDNRPLQDLHQNMLTICNELDLVTGGADRSALGAAATAMSIVGLDQFAGLLNYPGGLRLKFLFGYMVQSQIIDPQDPDFKVPVLGIHDKPTTFSNIQASSTPGRRIKYLVQARMDEPTANDRVPSNNSLIKVCRLSIKNSAEYVETGTEPGLAPDSGQISVLSFTLGYGQTSLTAADVKLLNMKDMSKLIAIGALGPVSLSDARIAKVRYEVSLAKGDQVIDVSKVAGLDLSLGADSIEVYVSGIYQTYYTVNATAKTISLGGPMVQNGNVLIQQMKIVPKA